MRGAWAFWWPSAGEPMTRRRFWANALPWSAVSFGALAFCVTRKGAVPEALHWLALTVALMVLVALEGALRARLRHAGWSPSWVGWTLFSVAVGAFLAWRTATPAGLAWAPAVAFASLCLGVAAFARGPQGGR